MPPRLPRSQELHKRIKDGEIGDIILMRGYRMHGPVGTLPAPPPKPADMSELVYQIRRFHSFLWASGGCFSDFHIHNIDEFCWMKNAWPVKAQGVGGRHYKTDRRRQTTSTRTSTPTVEYTFADGSQDALRRPQHATAPQRMYSSYVHGTKGSAVVSKSGDCGAPSSIYKGQAEVADNLIWQSTRPNATRTRTSGTT